MRGGGGRAAAAEEEEEAAEVEAEAVAQPVAEAGAGGARVGALFVGAPS